MFLETKAMKTLLIIGILVIGIAGQAFSMGHPHNIFAARKQLRTKASVSMVKQKTAPSICFQTTIQVAKTAVNERLVAVFSQLVPSRTN